VLVNKHHARIKKRRENEKEGKKKRKKANKRKEKSGKQEKGRRLRPPSLPPSPTLLQREK